MFDCALGRLNWHQHGIHFMSLSVTEIFIARSTHLVRKSSQVTSFPGILFVVLKVKRIAQHYMTTTYLFQAAPALKLWIGGCYLISVIRAHLLKIHDLNHSRWWPSSRMSIKMKLKWLHNTRKEVTCLLFLTKWVEQAIKNLVTDRDIECMPCWCQFKCPKAQSNIFSW